MSVCKGCPCDENFYCGLEVFDVLDKPPRPQPAACPHAAALRAVLENKDLVLVAVPKDIPPEVENLMWLSVDPNVTDFALDDGEWRENGDNFLTFWYRQRSPNERGR